MTLTGLHLLLTYQCNLECEHCFAWGSPRQQGTMTLAQVRAILRQARDLGTIEWIYFEGGEPFLYNALLTKAVELSSKAGFKTGIVSNGYWATDVEDAVECLRPFAGRVHDLSISSDRLHWSSDLSRLARNAKAAAEKLGIPVGLIEIAPPEATDAAPAEGQLPIGESRIMFRGRAAGALASSVRHRSWTEFTRCPHENLRDPGRVHVDPLGHVHVCQGISMGNLFVTPLTRIVAEYRPEDDPILGPLIEGGPAGVVRAHRARHLPTYADACHLCYEARRALRKRFPKTLVPDQMYGAF